jgi:hypothetical protein
MGDPRDRGLGLRSDHNLKLKVLGSKIATDGGLLAHRELDETNWRIETVHDSL